MDNILEQHLQITDAIKSRDSYQAHTAMKKHINFVVQFFRDKKQTTP